MGRRVSVAVLFAALVSVALAGSVSVTSVSLTASYAATGSHSVTGAVPATLTATFPSDYSFGNFAIGSTSTSTEQTMKVKSNKSWGVKLNSDQANGQMRQATSTGTYTGSLILANPMQWSRTTPTPSTSYTNLSSTPSLIAGSQSKTGNAGATVGVTYQQQIEFSDDPTPGTDIYKIVVTYDAQQGF